jgi:hypothetical protein
VMSKAPRIGDVPMRRNKSLQYIIIGMLALLLGCSSPYVHATAQRLRSDANGPKGRQSDLYQGLYYMGSDQQFHYFVICRAFAKNSYYQVERNDWRVEREVPFSRRVSGWVRILDGSPRTDNDPMASRKASDVPR